MTDLQHVDVDVAKVKKGDTIITEHGIYYTVIARTGRTLSFDGGFDIAYPDSGTVTVLR